MKPATWSCSVKKEGSELCFCLRKCDVLFFSWETGQPMFTTWGYGLFLWWFVEVSFLHILYKFHEIKLNVMKCELNCASWNSLERYISQYILALRTPFLQSTSGRLLLLLFFLENEELVYLVLTTKQKALNILVRDLTKFFK